MRYDWGFILQSEDGMADEQQETEHLSEHVSVHNVKHTCWFTFTLRRQNRL